MNIFKKNFIYNIINNDLSLGKLKKINTRFPPEPNGYLHIGHAKAICLNFGIAKDYNGKCNLRFDDTNPLLEEPKFIDSIKYDINWLGFNWNGKEHYSSDYFEKLYFYALELIKKNLAYVDELSFEEISKYRGTVIIPGINSPFRNRSVKENLILFKKMRNGYFNEGKACLRAKIDMMSPFMILRDPVLYRIKFSKHYKTGNQWCIYPMYDFAHCISDAIEGITHSLCTLEFQDNRRLYNWILKNINLKIKDYPNQYEFARLNMEYTILSKRKLNLLIKNNIVDGWDDPRMPTISGLRRLGYTAKSIKKFCEKIGISKQESLIKIYFLEFYIREELNVNAPRVMAVINPIKIVINNLPMHYKDYIMMPNNPQRIDMGTRKVVFSSEIYIDKADFSEIFKEKYKRLILGKEVRLRNAYVIKAEYIEKNNNGDIKKIFCSYDPNTLNKNPVDGRKISGVIHWVSAANCISAEFRLYEHLFNKSNPFKYKNYLDYINPNSLSINHGFIEKSILKNSIHTKYQFEREGYFCADIYSYSKKYPVFNRIVTLRNKFF